MLVAAGDLQQNEEVITHQQADRFGWRLLRNGQMTHAELVRGDRNDRITTWLANKAPLLDW
jgi:hypothetical protein